MKFYELELSTKKKILIDDNDYQKFIANSASGALIILKQGLINPSFVVSVTPTEKKMERVVEGHVEGEKYVVTKDTYLDPSIQAQMPEPLRRIG